MCLGLGGVCKTEGNSAIKKMQRVIYVHVRDEREAEEKKKGKGC